jgi:hypothetical protein
VTTIDDGSVGAAKRGSAAREVTAVDGAGDGEGEAAGNGVGEGEGDGAFGFAHGEAAEDIAFGFGAVVGIFDFLEACHGGFRVGPCHGADGVADGGGAFFGVGDGTGEFCGEGWVRGSGEVEHGEELGLIVGVREILEP